MKDLMHILYVHCYPDVAGFVVGYNISWWINCWIAKSQTSKFPQLLPPKTKEADRSWKIRRIEDLYDMKGAANVGRLERLIYVFSVMIGGYDIIAGWIIMKSFTMWLESPDVDKSKKLHLYHNYVIGTGWSLTVGLFCGEIGKLISTVLSIHLGLPGNTS
jgi:hypothetical protein